MADWGKLALIVLLVGYEANVLGTIHGGGNSDVQGLLITGFMLYTIAALLLAMQEAGVANKILAIILICCVLIAGILLIAGMGVWGSGMNAYRGTVNSTAALFALLGGVFLLVSMLTGGGGKTGPA